MIDQHMIQRMASFRKLICERDVQIKKLIEKLDQERAGREVVTAEMSARVFDQEAQVRRLLLEIGAHDASISLLLQQHEANLADLKAAYAKALTDEADSYGNAKSETETVTARLRVDVMMSETRLTALQSDLSLRKSEIESLCRDHDISVRKLRGGKYAEAKKLLAEMEAKLAKREAEVASAHDEPPTEVASTHDEPPTAVVKTDSVMICQNPACRKIAKPWVLSSSGAALCLECAGGQSPSSRPAVLVDVADDKLNREIGSALTEAAKQG
jgi:hypothetical protein